MCPQRDVCKEASLQLGLLTPYNGTKSGIPLVANGVEDLNFVENSSVIKSDSQGISDGARVGVVVVSREELVFNAFHLK